MTEEELFAKALEIPAVAREEFLRAACAGDRELHARVRHLLELLDNADDFLEAPLDAELAVAIRDAADESPPAAAPFCDANEEYGSFGGHELQGEIARGAMGIVYRARQTSLNRAVALKMINPALLSGKKEVERFRIEVQALARLDHPNIIPLYQVGEEKGQHYFSMQLVEGGTLRDRLDSFRGVHREAARFVIAVARAVHAAHECGILHRDLKPGNILIDNQGNPLVTDFGLAKDTGSGRELTAAGQVMGTPSYMAPEQARGDGSTITPAADVYSLGAILYEMLTGRPPHKAKTVRDTLRLVIEGAPAASRTIDPSIDGGLERIVMKCLANDPRRRPGSASRLAQALERWLQGEKATPSLPAAKVRAPVNEIVDWVRHNRMFTLVMSAIALVLLAITLAATVMVFRMGTAVRAAERYRGNIETGSEAIRGLERK